MIKLFIYFIVLLNGMEIEIHMEYISIVCLDWVCVRIWAYERINFIHCGWGVLNNKICTCYYY